MTKSRSTGRRGATPQRGKSRGRRGSARSASASKGWQTRKRRTQAIASAKRVFDAGGFSADWDQEHTWRWDHDEPGWEPEGGWQGDELAEEIAYMTHEEKIEWLEWLAEELDTTISELFEMMGSP